MQASSTTRLLVVDDEPAICEFVCDVATTLGIRACAAQTADEFHHHYAPEIDIIVLDIVMPGLDGVSLLRQLATLRCTAALLLISGFDERLLQSTTELAGGLGLRLLGHLSKPIRLGQLERMLNKLSPGVDNRPTRQAPSFALDEVRHAIASEALLPHFQPQIDLGTGRPIGVEALVRWQHPEHGLLNPGSFIPLAEAHGLIDDITMLVLRQTLSTCRRCRDEYGPLRFSINLSATSLHDLTLPDRIEFLVHSHGLDTTSLVLELTESGLMREPLTSLDILSRFRIKGMGLSIDDFGNGYSTLQQLRKIPFNELKIDHTLLANFERDASARVIIRNTIELAHGLGMPVVAEGIESMAAWDFLHELGCDIGQGFFIAPPLPEDALFDWMSRQDLAHQHSP